jgi:CubicO group peptidase (beta-lactamase class C family)
VTERIEGLKATARFDFAGALRHDPKMRPCLTRREVTASLALSWLLGVARGSRASARECGRLPSVSEQIKRLERQLEELRLTLKIPGVSAAIVKDQMLLWAKGLGFADVENKIPAAPETNYRIASLTKPFASTLLMQLVEQGKLGLDEPMAKYSPEFRQRFGRGPITVRHVFTHTSHDPSGDTYWYDGYRFSYLSDVIGRASGTPFRELLVKNILDTIGMADSVPGQDVLDDRTKWSASVDADHARRYEAGLAKLAKPYRLDGAATVRGIYPPRGISAAAGLVSNVLDLAKYDLAIDGHTFVRAETQERAWTPASTTDGRKLPYGLGWFIQSHDGARLVWHYGYWPESFSSLYLKLPERKISLILLANSDGLSAPFLLGAGDVMRSAFANSFLRIFVREESLGRALPDPPWSQSSDRFNAEIEQIAAQTGRYRYDAERVSHELLTRWLDERRRATPR